MSVLKVTTVGNSVGVILPKEILERLRVKRGDSLYVIETKNGIELTAYNPEFANQVEVAERVMREDRDALRKLPNKFDDCLASRRNYFSHPSSADLGAWRVNDHHVNHVQSCKSCKNAQLERHASQD